VKQVGKKIWLVSFMRYDLGFFDHETCRLESAENPFAAKLLPIVSGINPHLSHRNRHMS
jgi:putative transposase